MLDGRLYVVDDSAKLYVFDAKTGKQIATKKLGTHACAARRSWPTARFTICTGGGQWYVLKPTDERRRGRQSVAASRTKTCDASPIVSHGRIYVADFGASVLPGQRRSETAGRSAAGMAQGRRPATKRSLRCKSCRTTRCSRPARSSNTKCASSTRRASCCQTRWPRARSSPSMAPARSPPMAPTSADRERTSMLRS